MYAVCSIKCSTAMDREWTKCYNPTQRLLWWILGLSRGWWLQCFRRLGEEQSYQSCKSNTSDDTRSQVHYKANLWPSFLHVFNHNDTNKSFKKIVCNLCDLLNADIGGGHMHRHLCSGFCLFNNICQKPWISSPSGGCNSVFSWLCYLRCSSSCCKKHQRCLISSPGNEHLVSPSKRLKHSINIEETTTSPHSQILSFLFYFLWFIFAGAYASYGPLHGKGKGSHNSKWGVTGYTKETMNPITSPLVSNNGGGVRSLYYLMWLAISRPCLYFFYTI